MRPCICNAPGSRQHDDPVTEQGVLVIPQHIHRSGHSFAFSNNITGSAYKDALTKYNGALQVYRQSMYAAARALTFILSPTAMHRAAVLHNMISTSVYKASMSCYKYMLNAIKVAGSPARRAMLANAAAVMLYIAVASFFSISV